MFADERFRHALSVSRLQDFWRGETTFLIHEVYETRIVNVAHREALGLALPRALAEEQRPESVQRPDTRLAAEAFDHDARAMENATAGMFASMKLFELDAAALLGDQPLPPDLGWEFDQNHLAWRALLDEIQLALQAHSIWRPGGAIYDLRLARRLLLRAQRSPDEERVLGEALSRLARGHFQRGMSRQAAGASLGEQVERELRLRAKAHGTSHQVERSRAVQAALVEVIYSTDLGCLPGDAMRRVWRGLEPVFLGGLLGPDYRNLDRVVLAPGLLFQAPVGDPSGYLDDSDHERFREAIGRAVEPDWAAKLEAESTFMAVASAVQLTGTSAANYRLVLTSGGEYGDLRRESLRQGISPGAGRTRACRTRAALVEDPARLKSLLRADFAVASRRAGCTPLGPTAPRFFFDS